MTVQLEILIKRMSTYVVIVEGERCKTDEFSFDVIAVVFRFVVLFVVSFIVEMELTVDTGVISFAHIMKLSNQRIANSKFIEPIIVINFEDMCFFKISFIRVFWK